MLDDVDSYSSRNTAIGLVVVDCESATHFGRRLACGERIDARRVGNSRSWAACKRFCFVSGKWCYGRTYHLWAYVGSFGATTITFGASLLNPSFVSESILLECFLIYQVLRMDHRSGQAS